jgi:hypothetical protein
MVSHAETALADGVMHTATHNSTTDKQYPV